MIRFLAVMSHIGQARREMVRPVPVVRQGWWAISHACLRLLRLPIPSPTGIGPESQVSWFPCLPGCPSRCRVAKQHLTITSGFFSLVQFTHFRYFSSFGMDACALASQPRSHGFWCGTIQAGLFFPRPKIDHAAPGSCMLPFK